MAMFECVACGDIDVSLVHYDTNDTGAVAVVVNVAVRKAVSDLGLEPEDVWCERITLSAKPPFTAKRVCSAIASLFEADGRSLTPLLEYAAVHGVPHDRLVVDACCDSRDVYLPLIARLSERVSMGWSARRSLHNRVIETVRRVPELEFKLPNSVVVAVWWKHVGAASHQGESVCDWMNIKLPTIKRMLPLI